MAATIREYWRKVGYWGQWTIDLTLWDGEDANSVLWGQTFKPLASWTAPGVFTINRFSATKIRLKMWKTGEINSIGLVILPVKTYCFDGYNHYYRPDFDADPLATAGYIGVIPDVDPESLDPYDESDSDTWLEFILDEPFIAEGGHTAPRWYAIIPYVDGGSGILHWAYSGGKWLEAHYMRGVKAKGVAPYAFANWRECNTHSIGNHGFLFEIWGEDAGVQVPTVETLQYRLDKETPRTCIVYGAVTPWCGAKVTNKGIRWYKDGDEDNKFWKDIDVSDENYDYNTQSFSMELTNLEYDTLYYYRVEATNSEGTGEGEYETFTTLYPETSLKIEIKAEATATDLEIERAGNCETLLINNHLIQSKELAQVIADYYLEQYKDPRIIIRGNIVTPAPYERRDAIVFGEGEILYYTKAISAEIPYAAMVDAEVPYNYYNIATYGRMYLKKINPVFSAGNYVASIELEKSY